MKYKYSKYITVTANKIKSEFIYINCNMEVTLIELINLYLCRIDKNDFFVSFFVVVLLRFLLPCQLIRQELIVKVIINQIKQSD